MVTYTAIFSDNDKKTRTTDRKYTHAWRVSSKTTGVSEYGFAGSYALANKAANTFSYHKYNLPGQPIIEIVECFCGDQIADQEFAFENNMTESEARDKHAQLKALHSVARALLLEIRDRKGYLALGFSSFEEYGEKEWGYTRTYINRLANAEVIQKSLSVPIGTNEIPESQLRELGKVDAKERDAIYQQAKAEAEEAGKELTAKMIAEAIAEYKANAEKAQTDLLELKEKNQTISTSLSKEKVARLSAENLLHNAKIKLTELHEKVDQKAEELAAKKIEEKQAEMQEQLDDRISDAESEHQAAISDLKITISRLTQEKNTLLQSQQGTPESPQQSQLSTDLAKAQAELDNLLAKQVEAKAALNQLDYASVEINDTKRANHVIFGAASAIPHEIEHYLKQIESYCHADLDSIKCYYELTDRTKYALVDVARILKQIAKQLEMVAAKTEPELDHIDESFQSLGDFFLKWKKFRQENTSAGNDYDWWFSRLMEEKSTRLKKHLSNFKAVWERYDHEIRATNDVEVA